MRVVEKRFKKGFFNSEEYSIIFENILLIRIRKLYENFLNNTNFSKDSMLLITKLTNNIFFEAKSAETEI